jgi:predicted transcriptional regulator
VVGVTILSRVRSRLGRYRRVLVRDDRVPGLRTRVDELSRQVSSLQKRVEELDEELLDARSQGRRVAEVTDLVTSLLAHEAARRDPEFQRILDGFTREHQG